MNRIEIKKTDVALLKGLGYKTVDISKKYGITFEETIDMLKDFKLYNSKKTTKVKDYEIFLVDDTTPLTTNKAVELEFAN